MDKALADQTLRDLGVTPQERSTARDEVGPRSPRSSPSRSASAFASVPGWKSTPSWLGGTTTASCFATSRRRAPPSSLPVVRTGTGAGRGGRVDDGAVSWVGLHPGTGFARPGTRRGRVSPGQKRHQGRPRIRVVDTVEEKILPTLVSRSGRIRSVFELTHDAATPGPSRAQRPL